LRKPSIGSGGLCLLHIHVESGDAHAKFWLDPVSLAKSDGYNPRALARIRRLVEANAAELRERWRDFFHD
jgi:hypothetical protein